MPAKARSPQAARPIKSALTFGGKVPPVRRIPSALARRFSQICTAAAAESVADAGLTASEWSVLAYLNSFNGEPDTDQISLAGRLGIDRNTTSLLVERMESKGLLERRMNGKDRRVRLLRLTRQGEKLFRRVRPNARAAQERVVAVLQPAEREILLDLLVRVIEANRHLDRPGAGRRNATRRPINSQ
jgi:DNA-binding MarR family transcriptional regulator